jgi:hypothetical protein
MIRHRNRLTEGHVPSPTKVGWRVGQWAEDVGVSRAYVYELISAARINSVKLGAARIITTKPGEFLASLAEEAA